MGRIDFGDDLDAYARYVQSVLLAETGQVELPRRAAFFGVANPGDKATQLSAQYLVKSLYDNLQQPDIPGEIKLKDDWQLESFIGSGQATKAQLQRILAGDPTWTPTLLFAASHGMEFPLGHPQQLALQGALLCQDWDGPGTSVKRDHYFAGEDLFFDANLLGMMAVFFACYGAGTPKLDRFARQAFKARAPIAPQGFIGALPRRLLTQGALAVLGHVERAWGYSFISPGGHLDNQAFITALRKLFNGDPVGLATDPSFNMRYAAMSSDLFRTLEELEYDPGYVTDYELAYLWAASNDARSCVVIGDPATRLPVITEGPHGRRESEAVDLTPVYLNLLAAPSEAAILWAAGLCQAQDRLEVEPMDLLAGLFQSEDGSARDLLTLFDRREAVTRRLQDRIVLDYADVNLDEMSPPSAVEPRDVLLSKATQRALPQAYRFATSHSLRDIGSQFLLAALIDDEQNEVGNWIAELLGIEYDTLVRHTVGTLPEGPDLEALVSQVTVPAPPGHALPTPRAVRRRDLFLDGQAAQGSAPG